MCACVLHITRRAIVGHGGGLSSAHFIHSSYHVCLCACVCVVVSCELSSAGNPVRSAKCAFATRQAVSAQSTRPGCIINHPVNGSGFLHKKIYACVHVVRILFIYIFLSCPTCAHLIVMLVVGWRILLEKSGTVKIPSFTNRPTQAADTRAGRKLL